MGVAKFSLGGRAWSQLLKEGVASSEKDFIGESSVERRPGEEKMQLSAADMGVSGFFVGVVCDFEGVANLFLVCCCCC